MKKFFENPEIELEKFRVEDIMTESATEGWDEDTDDQIEETLG